jgi:hypothetical protein
MDVNKRLFNAPFRRILLRILDSGGRASVTMVKTTVATLGDVPADVELRGAALLALSR